MIKDITSMGQESRKTVNVKTIKVKVTGKVGLELGSKGLRLKGKGKFA
jgi:hypothetical protein